MADERFQNVMRTETGKKGSDKIHAGDASSGVPILERVRHMKNTLCTVPEERYPFFRRGYIESAMMIAVAVGCRERYRDISVPRHTVVRLA